MLLCLALVIAITGCAPTPPTVKRVALLAPFEGNYREIGYDALSPVRLALKDANAADVQLLSLDTGDDAGTAIAHAQSLAADPTVLLALVAGASATDARVLAAFGDVPVIVIGDWNAVPDENIFVLASADIDGRLTSRETDVYAAAQIETATGGETFGLKAFALLSENETGITVVTNAAPPAPEFTARLLESDLFVPQPGLLATTAYDAGTLAVSALQNAATRADVLTALRNANLDGLNGAIRFDGNGYWADAPVYEYRYVDGILSLSAQLR